MISPNFTTAFSVDHSPTEVFNAINDVRGCWFEEIEGRTVKVGDAFTYRHTDLHRSTQKLIEVIPQQRVVWLVVDGYLSFVEHEREWQGTKVVFDIASKSGRTEVEVRHEGLNPACERFDACSKGWDFYINSSLRSLITTGHGQPDQKENGAGQEASR